VTCLILLLADKRTFMLVNILPAENLFSRVKLWTGGILSTAH
jgi:hypothetical protein